MSNTTIPRAQNGPQFTFSQPFLGPGGAYQTHRVNVFRAGAPIAFACGIGSTEHEAIANAHLIATAPGLAETLRGLLGYCDGAEPMVAADVVREAITAALKPAPSPEQLQESRRLHLGNARTARKDWREAVAQRDALAAAWLLFLKTPSKPGNQGAAVRAARAALREAGLA